MFVGGADLVGTTDTQNNNIAIMGFASPITSTASSNVYTYDVSGISGTRTYFAITTYTSGTLFDLKTIVFNYSSTVTTTTYDSNPSFITASSNANVSSLGLTSTSTLTVANGAEITVDANASFLNLEIQGGGKVTNTSTKTLTVKNVTVDSDPTLGTGTYVETDGAGVTM